MHPADVRRRPAGRATRPPGGAGPRRRWMGPGRPGRRARQLAVAAPFVLPSLVGVVGFLLIPVVIVAVLSFFKWNFLTPPHWAGVSNYVAMSRYYHVFHALAVTAYYVLWNIPVQTAVALGLAVALNRKMPAMGLFRALYVLPYMSTPVAMAVVWSWLFNAQSGLVNHVLALVGMHGPDWLGDTHTALPVVAMVSNWQYAGYNMLFFLAGLRSIAPELYEAAGIDGAGAVRKFVSITL